MLVNVFKMIFVARSVSLLGLAALLVVLSAVWGWAADPDALWKIVHDRCVPNAERSGQPISGTAPIGDTRC